MADVKRFRREVSEFSQECEIQVEPESEADVESFSLFIMKGEYSVTAVELQMHTNQVVVSVQ